MNIYKNKEKKQSSSLFAVYVIAETLQNHHTAFKDVQEMHTSTHNYNMYTVCITKLIFNEDDLEFVNQSRMFIGTPCTWYDANINFGRKK